MQKSIQKLNKLFILILFVLAFAGCSDNAPKISQTFWQINLMHDQQSGKDTQLLTMFVMANDDDGLDDIDTMYVINDDQQLFWKLSGKNLRIERFGQTETWIGSNFITMLDGEPIPTGKYRVVLLDSSGERAKSQVTVVNNIKEIPEKWPVAEKRGDDLIVTGLAEYVWGLSYDGVFGGEFEVDDNGFVNTNKKKFSFYYLYHYMPGKGYGLINGPF